MLVPFFISSAEEQSSEERKESLSPCTHRPRRGTGLGLGSACCCPPGSRSPPISHPCEVHAKQLLNHCAPRLLQLSGVINNTSYPRSLFAGEGIRAQNILPPPPPSACISSKSRGSLTYANGINGESLQPGSQERELRSSDFKLHTRVP